MSTVTTVPVGGGSGPLSPSTSFSICLTICSASGVRPWVMSQRGLSGTERRTRSTASAIMAPRAKQSRQPRSAAKSRSSRRSRLRALARMVVLTVFFKVPSGSVGLYIFPLAVGNLLGPWILGRLFDTVGRRPMNALTYILSGVLLVITGLFFVSGVLTAVTITQPAGW